MIDFINPRSKKQKQGLIIGFIGLLLLVAGMTVTYKFVNEYIQAKSLSEINYLPSGDIVIDSMDAKQLLALYQKKDKNDSSQQLNEKKVDIATADKDVNDKDIVLSEKVEEKKEVNKDKSIVTEVQGLNKQISNQESIPNYNMLVIPQMGVRGKIYEGSSEKTLLKGLWHMPGTSSNPESGNVVVTAHRYLRRPPNPNTFYLLDKLKVGDEFYMYWQGKRYNYRVREIKVVKPEEVSILYNTPNPQLTLFSCTPLFTSKNRLVVISDLIK